MNAPPVYPQANLPPSPVPPSGEPRCCGLATWSMVCGILGLVTCLPAIPAVILGHIALSNIKKGGNALTGRGRAIAGLAMGYPAIAFLAMLPILGILAAIAVPSFVRARDRAQSSVVRNEARQLDIAKDQYALETRKGEGVTPEFPDLTPYLKRQSRLINNGGRDSKGNPFIIGPIGTPVKVNPETKKNLRSATDGDEF